MSDAMTAREALGERIRADFARGWAGTADEWWARHPEVSTINSIAPHFTHLYQDGDILPTGERRPTRHGGMARVFRGGAA